MVFWFGFDHFVIIFLRIYFFTIGTVIWCLKLSKCKFPWFLQLFLIQLWADICSIFHPLGYFLLCYLHWQSRNTEAEKKRANKERMPIVQTFINHLNSDKKKFKNLSSIARTQTESCICIKSFTDECEVTELQWSKNHVFHTSCLTGWMSFNTILHLCKKPV